MRRREEILRIVRDTPVHSQDELLAQLGKRGVKVTQPTLSRDLRELGLVKTAGGYVAPSVVTAPSPVATFVPRDVTVSRFEHLVRDFVVSAEAAGNLVVIKTPPAAAQPVASAIDTTRVDDDVLGTIGGDDTIFVAFRTPASASAFARRVQHIAGLTPQPRRASRS